MGASLSVETVVQSLKQLYASQGKSVAVIAVSGGIDSAVALTLLTKALGPNAVRVLLLPYQDQDMTDAQQACDFNQIPTDHRQVVNIAPLVTAAQGLGLGENDQVRLGNLMARSRMMVVFDLAKKLNGLVCGTENKSEHYLGYFTRFGDAASDIEPLTHWYKTQIRQVARELGIPEQIIVKAPSAGLWSAQTDELEMGFTYEVADQVLTELIDHQGWDGIQPLPTLPGVTGVDPAVVQQVVTQVVSQAFKRQVPYEVAAT